MEIIGMTILLVGGFLIFISPVILVLAENSAKTTRIMTIIILVITVAVAAAVIILALPTMAPLRK
jgi:hypothetical protein